MELLENMPINDTRWESAHSSILSNYRTSPIPYRATAGYVYDINALGINEDPRRNRFEKISTASVQILEEFYTNSIKAKKKLLSIVGDSSKIDLKELEKIGPIRLVNKEELFTR
jgi:hypothetical protein